MKLDILGRKYDVIVDRDEWNKWGESWGIAPIPDGVDGSHSYHMQKIFVDQICTLENQKGILIHEIVHGILCFGRAANREGHKLIFDSPDELEEYMIGSLDDGLAYVLSHNPKLLEFLAGKRKLLS